jgi:hypothetical protein
MRKSVCILTALTVFSAIAGLPPQKAFAYERYNRIKKFDTYFNKYTKRFFGPGFDWRHSKAQVRQSQLVQRSSLGCEPGGRVFSSNALQSKKFPSFR